MKPLYSVDKIEGFGTDAHGMATPTRRLITQISHDDLTDSLHKKDGLINYPLACGCSKTSAWELAIQCGCGNYSCVEHSYICVECFKPSCCSCLKIVRTGPALESIYCRLHYTEAAKAEKRYKIRRFLSSLLLLTPFVKETR